MRAGKKLDMEIGTRVFGDKRQFHSPLKHKSCPNITRCGSCWDLVQRYSTDIAAALEVVEALYKMGLNMDLTYRIYAVDGNFATVTFYSDAWTAGQGDAGKIPLAICIAALKAVERGVENT